MTDYIDVDDLKRRFGYLLSYLAKDISLSNEQIDNLVFSSSYFDCLENGNASWILDEGFDDIYRKLFSEGKPVQKLADDDARFVWAGESYISVCLRYRIPLKKAFLLCPLGEMLSLFDPYHEMSLSALMTIWKSKYNEKSVLPLLLAQRDVSLKTVSAVTGINYNSLSRANYSVKALQSLSSQSLYRLAGFLNVSLSYFKEESSFCYLESFYLTDPVFLSLLSQAYGKIAGPKYQKKASQYPQSCLPLIVAYDFSPEELIQQEKKTEILLVQGYPSLLSTRFGKKKKKFTDYEKEAALFMACRQFQDYLNKQEADRQQ